VAKNSAPHGSEEYLEAIYELAEEGDRVTQSRVAQRLGVSRATVSEQVKRLVKQGLLTVSDDRAVGFTTEGHRVAEDAVRKHRMTERFLTDVLKLPWHLAHQEANSFQSGITDEISKRMLAMLDGPATCPHGNPILGTGATFRTDLVPLDQIETNADVVLERLLEDIELHTDVLRYFEEHGLMPGASLRVLSVEADGSRTVKVGVQTASIGAELADNLWVRPA
jgi:DtxR family Mn-dependent transcriptional regulator